MTDTTKDAGWAMGPDGRKHQAVQVVGAMTPELPELPPGMHPAIPNCENYEDRPEQDAWMEIASKYGFKYDGNGCMEPPGWMYTGELLHFCRQIHDAAVRQERERCARIAETVALEAYCSPPYIAQREKHRADTAAAIRRGNDGSQ